MCSHATINFPINNLSGALLSLDRYGAKVICLPASTLNGTNKSRTYRHLQNFHTSLTNRVKCGIFHKRGFRKFEYGRTVECSWVDRTIEGTILLNLHAISRKSKGRNDALIGSEAHRLSLSTNKVNSARYNGESGHLFIGMLGERYARHSLHARRRNHCYNYRGLFLLHGIWDGRPGRF